MSFWNLDDGSNVTETTTKEFDGGGGAMVPIPEGTTVLAMPDDVKWAEDRAGNEFLSLRWLVVKPQSYAGRKIFTKLWLTDDDPRAKDPQKKRDKAKRMLAAIDMNAGSKLGRKTGKPSDDDLAVNLVNKQMAIRLGMYSIDGDQGDKITGNYVQAVSPKDSKISEVPIAKKPASSGSGNSNRISDDLDGDDVPFIFAEEGFVYRRVI